MTSVTQRSFTSGEISPSLYARVDLTKYATGLRTAKNVIIQRYGGASNRPGTSFLHEASPDSLLRIIPFFNGSDVYTIGLAQYKYYFFTDSGIVTDPTTIQTVNSVSKASQAIVTVTAHGFSGGEKVIFYDLSIAGVIGMEELAGRVFIVDVINANAFYIKDQYGNFIDSTNYTTLVGGKLVEPLIRTHPYTDDEIFDVDFAQSNDIISLVHPNHAPRYLTFNSPTSWSSSETIFQPTVAFPTAVASTVGVAGAGTFAYKVTAIDEETGEESLPGTVTTTRTITAVTKGTTCTVTSNAHGYANDDEIYIDSVGGMVELNKRIFTVSSVAANTFVLTDVDSTNYTTYTSGGTANLIIAKISAAGTPTAAAPNIISWTAVSGALEYNIYKETNGVYGQIGVASNTTFRDINITPNTSYTPPTTRNPFIGAGNYPSAVTFIQQRKAYANTDNDPEKIWLSRTGNFDNFTTSNPLQDDDAVTFNLAGRRVNSVKFMLDLGRLVIGTDSGEWGAEGNESGVITPTSINAKQYSYNGSGTLSPIIIDGAALYQQARGSIIRDLSYDLNVDGYAGNDLTIFSAHLFDKYTLVDWAYQQIPHSILWVVRSDGILLGLTYVRNQQVLAWHRHDLGGLVESVSVVPGGNEDVLYVVVNRTIDGESKRFVERLNTRQVIDVKDNIFMDSSLTYDGTGTGTMTLTGGTDWTYLETLTLTASVADSFYTQDVGNEIHLTSSTGELVRLTIISRSSGTVVLVRANKTIPVELRGVASSTWSMAVDELINLWHLEGEEVSVYADGFVVANPNNDSYDTLTVTNGTLTLDKCYSLIHVGLPYISDIETLNIDSVQGETISDKKVIISKVNMFVEDTRGVFVGGKAPSDDAVDPLEGLNELKIRNEEGYDSPVDLATNTVEVNIVPAWNSNGRVFVRQVDPLPMTILSITPAGKIPFK